MGLVYNNPIYPFSAAFSLMIVGGAFCERVSGVAMMTPRPSPRFNEDGSFKIVQFTDLHFGEAESTLWGPFQDLGSLHVIGVVLDEEKPDLVAFTGDQITGNNIMYNQTAYWNMIVDPLVKRKVPWASIFGNHDTMSCCNAQSGDGKNATASRRELMDFDTSFPLSHSKPATNLTHAVSTYYIDVLLPSSDQTGARLWFFDTGGGSYPEHMFQDQVDWFVSTHHALPAAKVELAFLHIPLPEYVDAREKGTNCFGMADDGVATTDNNGNLFEALRSAGVRATFVGHNHGNDWCCEVNGVYLCFGRHSGHGGYGKWDRGGRTIEIEKFGASVQTHVRMENTSTIHAGILYPAHTARDNE